MTARIYPSALGALQNGSLDWTTLSVRGILMSQGFVYDGTKIYRDELNEAFVIAESEEMTNPARNGSVVTGDPIEWLQLSDNRDVYHIVLYDDTGDDAYSPLLAYFGAEDVEGLAYDVNGQNYYLYPVFPPGGFFQFGLASELVGPVSTYKLAAALSLAETEGGVVASIPVLVFGLDLDVNERVCLRPDVVDSDQCGDPVIGSSLCE